MSATSKITAVGVPVGVLALEVGLSALDLPRVVVWGLIGFGLAALAVVWASRRYVIRRRRNADDPNLPLHDDRRDLADNLDVLAQRLADWQSRHEVQRPSIIEGNVKSVLAAMARVAREEPERFESYRQATRHYDRVMRTEYALTFQPEAMHLFDAAVEAGAVTPKARHRVQKPDASEIRQLPDALRDLAARVRTPLVATAA